MRPAAATRPPEIGMTSAVVLPTSSISASGCRAPTASALATQLAAATSSGRARASATSTSSPAVVRASTGPATAASTASSTSATPSRLVANWSESSAVIVRAVSSGRLAAELGDDLAHDGGRARRGSRELVEAQHRAPRVAVAPTAFVLTPPMSTPITPGIRDASRSCV